MQIISLCFPFKVNFCHNKSDQNEFTRMTGLKNDHWIQKRIKWPSINKAAENRLQKVKTIKNRFSKTSYIIYLVPIALNPFILEKSLQWKYSLICF